MRIKSFLIFAISALSLLSETAYSQGLANQTAEEKPALEAAVGPGEPETTLKSAQSLPAVSRVEPPVEKKITAIEVQGNRFISSAVILSKIKTRLGSAYSTNIISEDIKRVNELGYFSDIKIDTQDFEEGIKVFIIVIEKSLIGKIVFKGYFSRIIREEKLRETIKLKEGQYLDE